MGRSGIFGCSRDTGSSLKRPRNHNHSLLHFWTSTPSSPFFHRQTGPDLHSAAKHAPPPTDNLAHIRQCPASDPPNSRNYPHGSATREIQTGPLHRSVWHQHESRPSGHSCSLSICQSPTPPRNRFTSLLVDHHPFLLRPVVNPPMAHVACGHTHACAKYQHHCKQSADSTVVSLTDS